VTEAQPVCGSCWVDLFGRTEPPINRVGPADRVCVRCDQPTRAGILTFTRIDPMPDSWKAARG
jgi:hypothetical protein